MLVTIFKRCPNLKELLFTDVGIEFDEYEEELPQLKLNLLKVTYKSRIYDLLKNSFVKSFKLTIIKNTPSNASLQQFFTRQKNLQNMTLKFFNGIDHSIPDFYYENVAFELPSLKCCLEIIRHSKYSLEKIKIKFLNETEYLNTLAAMPNLKVLDIAVDLSTIRKNFLRLPQVEHLVIDANLTYLIFFSGKFPNLKSLEIKKHQTKSIFECYTFLMEMIVGSCDLIIEKATVGMDAFKSHDSKFKISQETQVTQLDFFEIIAQLEKIKYILKEITTKGIFTTKNKVLKVTAVNKRFDQIVSQVQSDRYIDQSWMNIFGFLGKKDLFALTLTCKKFNSIIGNSVDLMSRIPVTINHELEFYQRRRVRLTFFYQIKIIENFPRNPLLQQQSLKG